MAHLPILSRFISADRSMTLVLCLDVKNEIVVQYFLGVVNAALAFRPLRYSCVVLLNNFWIHQDVSWQRLVKPLCPAFYDYGIVVIFHIDVYLLVYVKLRFST